MERSQEYESVFHVPPLQFKEEFFVLTYTASLIPRSNQFSSVPIFNIIDINLMSPRNYVFEDCRTISIVTRSTLLSTMMLQWFGCLTNTYLLTSTKILYINSYILYDYI